MTLPPVGRQPETESLEVCDATPILVKWGGRLAKPRSTLIEGADGSS